jgi:hypothetical protein
LVHELKLWGKDCVFAKEQAGGEGRTGKMMVETLLSDPVLPCSHAAKALCLMRNVNPYQCWATSNASKEAKE